MSKRRIRVLHVIQNLNYGGMERVLADIVRTSDPALIESHVLCLQYMGRYSQALDSHATLHLSPPLGHLSMLWPRRLIGDIRRISPDVVHTHSGVWYKASMAARAADVPRLVHTEHGRAHFDPWLHRVLDSLAARRTDAIVAVSEVLGEYVAQTLGVRNDRVHVIRNGVDTETFRPRSNYGSIHDELGIDRATPIIGSIGRLEPVKDYGSMLRAFHHLLEEWTDGPLPVLVIVGDGSERSALSRRALSLGCGDRVHLLGWRDDVDALHAAFTIFTLSSTSEGTSISLLEALSAGLCPVVTNVGGNPAVLGSDLAHRLVPPRKPRVLAQCWKDALVNVEARRRDQSVARRRVEREYSVDQMVREYERLYLEDLKPIG